MAEASPGLRSSLAARSSIVATFVMIARVEIVEMLALARFDAVILDLEHGPLGVAELPALAAVAKAAGVHSIARIGDARPIEIGAALDAGFDGVMVPHVSSGKAAVSAVDAARFPPQGDRSLNPYVRGAGYQATTPDRVAELNQQSAVIAMIEGRDGLEALDEILATPGLDAIFVGPVDLSGTLGFPGDPEHPEVVARISSIFERATGAGMACGVYAPTPERAAAWFDRGASLVAVSADAAMAGEAFRATRGRVTAAGSVART